ncbi:aminodeoxychorismate/anthranilate synthase component II [Mammaliicoccus sp. Dog046]|uniref:anthranilate synthase component II n=1 Tax=Mammaliicoccus sp. Dog046 TaxID=3034233 RepID=UPI002B258E50|nr:aminodeoxychorismate/anthranilate synthase component II [Mammaliicoccus sp. Dog046]WQK85044.1 aminodeoxychorismate/anthranilate synthase component II [Mammaliicoccus sp. Dog046]
MIMMIDNHDSFTYNIIEYIKVITNNSDICVLKSEEVTFDKMKDINPKVIIISPGPGHPDDYVNLKSSIIEVYKDIPILGVCLGFQLLISAFGGNVIKGLRPIHGHTTSISHDGEGIFEDLPQSFQVTRYHSLIADKNQIPEDFIVTAYSEDDIPMAIRHRSLPIEAVQYHPESILSEFGMEQFANFLRKVGVEVEDTYTV